MSGLIGFLQREWVNLCGLGAGIVSLACSIYQVYASWAFGMVYFPASWVTYESASTLFVLGVVFWLAATFVFVFLMPYLLRSWLAALRAAGRPGERTRP